MLLLSISKVPAASLSSLAPIVVVSLRFEFSLLFSVLVDVSYSNSLCGSMVPLLNPEVISYTYFMS